MPLVRPEAFLFGLTLYNDKNERLRATPGIC